MVANRPLENAIFSQDAFSKTAKFADTQISSAWRGRNSMFI
jgi:hypothetical protein